jgi:murein L,D-transpeptidase YcbB/YkuD
MRIDKPQELAELLLRDQKQWTPDSIASARSRGGQKQVMLSQKVPVWILYLTCTVDDQGVVHFWDDVYGYDDAVWSGMTTRAGLQFTLTSL